MLSIHFRWIQQKATFKKWNFDPTDSLTRKYLFLKYLLQLGEKK